MFETPHGLIQGTFRLQFNMIPATQHIHTLTWVSILTNWYIVDTVGYFCHFMEHVETVYASKLRSILNGCKCNLTSCRGLD